MADRIFTNPLRASTLFSRLITQNSPLLQQNEDIKVINNKKREDEIDVFFDDLLRLDDEFSKLSGLCNLNTC